MLFRSDGLAVARRLRRTQAPDLPIIAITANAAEADQRACFEAGMNDHIAKPVDMRQLQQALLRWLVAAPALRAPVGGSAIG